MKASFVDLRRKSRQIIQALQRKEQITVLYRGRPAAIMRPIDDRGGKTVGSAADHPAFGLWADREQMKDASAYIRELRRGRFDAL